MRICLLSPVPFPGNTASHVFSVAENLAALGHDPIVLVPERPEDVRLHRTPSFPVLDFQTAVSRQDLPFSQGAKPDIVHAWTPREHVRKATEALVGRSGCPYLVHMEDNEEVVLANELARRSDPGLPFSDTDHDLPQHLIDPRRHRRFHEGAAGYTCLIDTLLAFKPVGVPGLVFWPGFDPEFETIGVRRTDRGRFGLTDTETVVLYAGAVHPLVVEEVRAVYVAVALLRQAGMSIRLLRTGPMAAEINLASSILHDSVVDLGFLPRNDLASVLATADILIQPGAPNPFNDYRFPSKVPEYLVSGRPVILPDTNIGRWLIDGLNAIKLTNSQPGGSWTPWCDWPARRPFRTSSAEMARCLRNGTLVGEDLSRILLDFMRISYRRAQLSGPHEGMASSNSHRSCRAFGTAQPPSHPPPAPSGCR